VANAETNTKKNLDEDWFRCRGCKQWYHGECLDLSESAIEDRYFVFNSCPKCEGMQVLAQAAEDDEQPESENESNENSEEKTENSDNDSDEHESDSNESEGDSDDGNTDEDDTS
jgi:hypothetical protein